MGDRDLIRCYWTGTALEPASATDAALLEDRLGAGQVVQVDVDPPRSRRSHNHQFGFVHQAWLNLPENLRNAAFAVSAEHLRKHALIACGYCHSDMIASGDPLRAAGLARVLRRVDDREGTYSIIDVSGTLIHRHTAESQSMKAMGGKERFQKSKQDILEYLAEMIGVTPDALAKMGKREAA